jgi:polyisoprenoid-binding protein YceI
MQAPSGHTTTPPLGDLLAGRALAGQWVLDPGQSSIRLRSRVLGGLIRVTGVFSKVSGDAIVSPAGQVSGTLTVAAASIDTKNPKRDTHLRSADFFDTGNTPDIIFTATGIRPPGPGADVTGTPTDVTGTLADVTGTLTVRDQTQPLSFPAGVAVQGDGDVWLDAVVHINRTDFGLTWNFLGMVAKDSTLTIHAVFTRR